jgi:hypothetical protein
MDPKPDPELKFVFMAPPAPQHWLFPDHSKLSDTLVILIFCAGDQPQASTRQAGEHLPRSLRAKGKPFITTFRYYLLNIIL